MANESAFDGLPEVLTVSEVAGFLRVAKRTVYQEIETGGLGCFRVGRAIRVTREQLENYVISNACGCNFNADDPWA